MASSPEDKVLKICNKISLFKYFYVVLQQDVNMYLEIIFFLQNYDLFQIIKRIQNLISKLIILKVHSSGRKMYLLLVSKLLIFPATAVFPGPDY